MNEFQWALFITKFVSGKGGYDIKPFNSEDECLAAARTEWLNFYDIRVDDKYLTTNYKNASLSIQKEVKCDPSGHCTIK